MCIWYSSSNFWVIFSFTRTKASWVVWAATDLWFLDFSFNNMLVLRPLKARTSRILKMHWSDAWDRYWHWCWPYLAILVLGGGKVWSLHPYWKLNLLVFSLCFLLQPGCMQVGFIGNHRNECEWLFVCQPCDRPATWSGCAHLSLDVCWEMLQDPHSINTVSKWSESFSFICNTAGFFHQHMSWFSIIGLM